LKYSIVIPYISRAPQFHNTLLSFRHWYGNRRDIEVIVVQDRKNTDADMEQILKFMAQFPELNIRSVMCSIDTRNPSPHYNQGVDIANGKYIIITNPECFHETDVIGGLDRLHEDNTYIVCACKYRRSNLDFPQKYEDVHFSSTKGIKTGELDWYQHTQHRDLQYHFCSSLSKENYLKIGGFDERYIHGMGYDDLDFITTIRKSDMKIMSRDDLVVVHQYHEWTTSISEVCRLTQINSIEFGKKWPGLKYDT
jgi:hypothetical protein